MNFSLQLTEDAVMHKYAIVFLDSGLGLRAGKFHARIFSSSSSLLHESRTSAFVFFLFVRSFICSYVLYVRCSAEYVSSGGKPAVVSVSFCRCHLRCRLPRQVSLQHRRVRYQKKCSVACCRDVIFLPNLHVYWQTSCNVVVGCLSAFVDLCILR